MAWLNKSSGVAARNGTNSHTINFATDGDAPFTPTNGSVLWVIAYGGVTHTVSGWTEHLQPVNSGELSVFSRTASSTTSITIGHNGSNYPINWIVFEFPAGSTYTAGTSNNASHASNQVWPALSGLPGTAQVIIAARGQAQAATGGSTITAGWTTPWVEEYDQVAPHATTDGCWMNVACALNQTGTTVTPTSTFTTSNTTNNIQQVVFAINVPSGTTPFQKDVVLNWRVLNNFQKDVVLNWRVLNAFTKDVVLNWRVRNLFQKDVDLQWRVLGAFVKDYVLSWRVLGIFQKDADLRWRVRNLFTKDYVILWNVKRSDITVWNGTEEIVVSGIAVWNGTTETPAEFDQIV